MRLDFNRKDESEKIIKHQSKLTSNGNPKLYGICDSYIIRQNEVLMDKPIYFCFAILELSKLHMYETCYDKLQPYFGKENMQIHCIDTGVFVPSVNTKDIIKDLKNLEGIFDFDNIDENQILFSNKNKKVSGKFKKTPKKIWIDEFVCLKIKMYSFKRGDNINNKLKGFSKSQSKHNKFEDYYNCFFGGEYQKGCDNYNIRSLNHEMYLQRVKKIYTIFVDKRC